VVVDLSTASPARTRERHARLAARGVELLDAGVSGGPRAAEAGTLTLMVGGSEAALERARPCCSASGRRSSTSAGRGPGTRPRR
jgi:3-hydroxyisobutyrate dehydrogenase-like beta-hydroxyacid dehydrogenase